MKWGIGIAVMAAALVLAQGATAAPSEVSVVEHAHGGPFEPAFTDASVTVTAPSGDLVAHDVTVDFEGPTDRAGSAYVITDSAGATAGTGCAAVDERTVRCVEKNDFYFSQVVVTGGAGADRMAITDRSPLQGGCDAKTGCDLGYLLQGGGGDDRLQLHEQSRTHGFQAAVGGAGADYLIGGSGSEMLDGGAGADVLNGLGGGDDLRGGPGNDLLKGGGGDDKGSGGPGRDVLKSIERGH